MVTGEPSSTADDQRPHVDAAEKPLRGVGGGPAQQVFEHGLLASLLAGLELQLAPQHVDHGGEVDHAGDRLALTEDRRAVPRRRGDGLGRRDREPGGHARALIDRLRFAQVSGEPRQDLQQVVGHRRGKVRLLRDDGDLGRERQRVVGADLGAEPVLERGDDPAAVGVVLGVGARHDEHVERQAQRVPAHLDVALLHHVEHRHLDALGEVGQLVDGDDAAVRAGNQAVGDGLGVTEAAALGHLDRVDVTDEVGDAGVRRRELLGVALAAVPPRHRQVVTGIGSAADRLRGDGRVRVLVELGARDHRCPLVEQPGQCAQQSGLALPALAEQNQVVPGDQRALQLRQDGVLEAEDAGPDVAAVGQRGEEVLPDFDLDAALAMTGGTELAERAREIVR